MSNCVFYVKNGPSIFRLLELVYGAEAHFGWEDDIMIGIDVLIAAPLCRTYYIEACGTYLLQAGEHALGAMH
jgi:hypothetical protein